MGQYQFDAELAWQLGEKAVFALGILLVTWTPATTTFFLSRWDRFGIGRAN